MPLEIVIQTSFASLSSESFGWSRILWKCELDFVPDGLLQILSNGLVLTSGTVTLDLGVRVVKYESQSVSFCCSPSAPPPLVPLVSFSGDDKQGEP